MRMIRSAITAAIAKKLYDEARKPENQQRIKDLITQFTSKNGGRRPGGRRY